MDSSRFLGFAIIFAAVLICAGLVTGGFLMRTAPPTANTVKVEIPESPVDGSPSRSISVLSPERILYVDDKGRLHDIAMPDGKRPYIREVYTITHAPRRHAGSPEKKTLHGFYVDTITVERQAEIDRAQRRFLDTAPARSLQAALDAAQNLAELGEHTFLLEQLDTELFVGRRAAAIELGKSGYVQAVPVLIELLGDKDLDLRTIAIGHLKQITGKNFVENIQVDVQFTAMEKYKAWWKDYQANQKKPDR